MEENDQDRTEYTTEQRHHSGVRGRAFLRVGHTVSKNLSLFAGIAMTVWGLLHFSSGRYCDGTSADHFSCINSATYYFYDVWTILVVIFGALLITHWLLSRS
jgi:hypothetical protein